MGNQLSGTVPQQIHPVEFYLSELSSSELLTFDCNMGSTRFFKVARIKLHQSRTQLTSSFQQPRLNSHLELNTTSSKLSSHHGQLEPELPALGVAKVFVINDPSLPLRTHKEKIEQIAHRLRSLPNCLTYKKLIVNDRVAVLLRQYIKYNLYDRLSTRPFLSLFEKKWISFQLLRCLQALHANGVTHGDIKLENVLITSSGWVLLTDFASYKPALLPEDNPADFSYFFDTSRRRICNVAPERFASENFFNEPMEQFATIAVETTQLTSDHSQPSMLNAVTPEMDLFSLGCVLCELFAEDSLFDLSTLLTYRAKGYVKKETAKCGSQEQIDETEAQEREKDPTAPDQTDGQGFPLGKVLNLIELPEIRQLVINLIDLRPEARGDCTQHIKDLVNAKVFPRYFEPVHKYLSDFNQLSADEKILKMDQDLNKLSQIIVEESSNGILLLVNSVLPCLRSLKHVHAKLTGISLLLRLVRCNRDPKLTNHLILERVLPYFIDEISKETNPKVKSHTIQCLTELLSLIQFVPNSDKNVFPDYILPVLCKAVSDESALVRIQLARDLPTLSSIAIRYLNTYNLTSGGDQVVPKQDFADIKKASVSQDSSPNVEDRGMSTGGSKSDLAKLNEPESSSNDSSVYNEFVVTYQNFSNYASELKALQSAFQYITYCILTDREISIRIELMLNPNLVQLCTFFGKQKTNEIIFSHLITFLNERSDFELRSAFFQCIVPIGCYLGTQSSPLLKPLLQQGFTDPEETVINQAINSTAQLAELQLIPKKTTIELLSEAIPLIVHPNLWIRHSLVRLITCCSGQLNLAELNCKLLPLIRAFLNADQQENLLYLSNTVSDTSLLLDNLVKPVPRAIFDLLNTKISSTQQLDLFFETLEKRKMVRIASLTIPRISGSTSSLTSMGINSPSMAIHQTSMVNLNAANLIGMANKGLLSHPPGSLINSDTNHLSYCAPPSLISFFDLLIEEGLTDQIELNLMRMAELIKRIYRQIRSARSVANNGSNSTQTKQSSSKSSWLQPKHSSILSISGENCGQVKRKSKRLFSIQLNELANRPANENEWHITSSISGESSNNEELQINQDGTNSESFEIAKEAKELGDKDSEEAEEEAEEDGPSSSLPSTPGVVTSGDEQLEDTNKILHSFAQLSCPPCVSELNYLIRHKQYKFGEALGNAASDCFSSISSNITLSNTPHSSTINELSQNGNNNQSRLLGRYLRSGSGYYALSNYRPQGRLIANLLEHTNAVSKIVSIDCGVSGKGSLFASSSLDGSIRLWDASKMNLGKNLINKSKQVFDLNNVETGTTFGSKNDSFNGMTYSYGKEYLIAHTGSGDLYVIKVDGRSSKMSLFQRVSNFGSNFTETNRKCFGNQTATTTPPSATFASNHSNHPVNNSITDISSNSPFVFICSFSNSNINAFDLRMPLNKPIWKLGMQPSEGLITCITEGDYSIFAGTSYGKIATFDTRFSLRSNSMCYNIQKRVRKLLFTQQGLFVSVQGYNEISLWDCESGSRLKTLWASNAPPLTNKTSNNSVHSLIAGGLSNGEFGSLITCSSDARIRYWDLINPHRSYIIVDNAYRTVTNHSATLANANNNFSVASNGAASATVSYISKFMEGMQVIQEFHHQEELNAMSPSGSAQSLAVKEQPPSTFNNYHSWDPQAISPSHKDVIMDICWVNSCNLLASGSRDGCIKLWK